MKKKVYKKVVGAVHFTCFHMNGFLPGEQYKAFLWIQLLWKKGVRSYTHTTNSVKKKKTKKKKQQQHHNTNKSASFIQFSSPSALSIRQHSLHHLITSNKTAISYDFEHIYRPSPTSVISTHSKPALHHCIWRGGQFINNVQLRQIYYWTYWWNREPTPKLWCQEGNNPKYFILTSA